MPALSNRLGQLAPYPFVEISRIIAEKRAAGTRATHGADDPAGHPSAALGINPPFRLAKFIDEYNWLTIERGMEYRAVTA